MRVAVTGPGGFLGWHVRCRAFFDGVDTVPVGRDLLYSPALADTLAGVDAVLHCAGATRGTDAVVTDGNVNPALRLADTLSHLDDPPRVVYANTVQRGTVYGQAKRQARDVLGDAGPDRFSDVVLANLYGEHGRPFHNSFVATFAHQLVVGETPEVVDDKVVELVDAQEAAAVMLAEAGGSGWRQVQPAGDRVVVSSVLATLHHLDEVYRRRGQVPDLGDPFMVRLFNAYRSHLPPRRLDLKAVTDGRGTLAEVVRVGSGGRVFASSTLPGQVRGEHVHARRLERFAVLDGAVQVGLRRMWHQSVRLLTVGPGQAVDVPTLWVHNLSNVGDDPATVVFWSSETGDADADTWPCRVDRGDGGP